MKIENPFAWAGGGELKVKGLFYMKGQAKTEIFIEIKNLEYSEAYRI